MKRRKLGLTLPVMALFLVCCMLIAHGLAMAKTKPLTAPSGRYRPSDKLLAYLEAL